MSGLEVYGAIGTLYLLQLVFYKADSEQAATASLIPLAFAARDHTQRASKTLQSLKSGRLLSESQINSLRRLYRTLSSTFDTYSEIERNLSREVKDNIEDLMKEIFRNTERCEEIVTKLKTTNEKSGNNRIEPDMLREELKDAANELRNLKNDFQGLIGLETYRVVSGNKSDHETPRTPEPSFRGESQADSGSITSLEAQHGGLHRQDTSGLAQTLVQPATFNSISGSSAWSATDSTNSTSTLCFSESKQLRSAVCEEDFLWIQRQIKEGKSENEVESRKASALLLACRYRKKDIVRSLLSSDAAIDLTDDNGLGVLHCTIGKAEILNESLEGEIVDILRLLVEYKARVSTGDESELKQQPLHYCAMTGKCLAAEYILSVDPDVINLADGNGKTALYHACEHLSPKEKLVKLLLKKNATFGEKNRPNLHNVRHQRICKMLDNVQQRGKRLTD